MPEEQLNGVLVAAAVYCFVKFHPFAIVNVRASEVPKIWGSEGS
jgi:hypothetical protein